MIVKVEAGSLVVVKVNNTVDCIQIVEVNRIVEVNGIVEVNCIV